MNNVVGEGGNIGFDYQMCRDSIANLAVADIIFDWMRGRRAPGHDEATTWESPGTCAQVTQTEPEMSSAVFVISPVDHWEGMKVNLKAVRRAARSLMSESRQRQTDHFTVQFRSVQTFVTS